MGGTLGKKLAGALGFLVAGLAACSESPPAGAPTSAADSAVLRAVTGRAESGAVHHIRLTQQGDRYAFEPAAVAITSGDIVRFVMVGSQPESVVFETDRVTPEAGAFLTERNLHRGILLTEPGAAYDVSFAGAPPGTFPFRSIPHAEMGMRGTVQVSAE